MIEIAFLIRIYIPKNKYERNWAKYGRKYVNYKVRGHTLKTIHKGMLQISQNIIHI